MRNIEQLERRLDRLEQVAASSLQPAFHVMAGPDGTQGEAFAEYRAQTPANRRAPLVVFVRTFGGEA